MLKKVTDLTSAEIEALLFLQTCLAADPRFSLVRVAQASEGTYDREFLAHLLAKYASIQDDVFQALLEEMVKQLGRRSTFFLSIDDQLVNKRGKKIYGVGKWADHQLKRKISALCLVDVAVVVQGQAVLAVPYLVLESLVPPAQPNEKRSTNAQEQDAKTTAALALITQLVGWLEILQVRRNKIGVLADAWYSNKRLRAFIRRMGLDYRIAGKKNYQVHMPDFKRIQRRKYGGRGRRPARYVRTRRLDQHMETVTRGGSFLDKTTGKRVRWKMATVTLDTGGRSRIFAFWRDGSKEPKYILTPARTTGVPGAPIVYRDYLWRWRVEEVHRDLKQQFGLRKSRNRKQAIVLGFLGLVYAFYSVFLLVRHNTLGDPAERLTAPRYQDAQLYRLYVEQRVTFV